MILSGEKGFETIDYFQPPYYFHYGNDAVPYPILKEHPQGSKDDKNQSAGLYEYVLFFHLEAGPAWARPEQAVEKVISQAKACGYQIVPH